MLLRNFVRAAAQSSDGVLAPTRNGSGRESSMVFYTPVRLDDRPAHNDPSAYASRVADRRQAKVRPGPWPRASGSCPTMYHAYLVFPRTHKEGCDNLRVHAADLERGIEGFSRSMPSGKGSFWEGSSGGLGTGWRPVGALSRAAGRAGVPALRRWMREIRSSRSRPDARALRRTASPSQCRRLAPKSTRGLGARFEGFLPHEEANGVSGDAGRHIAAQVEPERARVCREAHSAAGTPRGRSPDDEAEKTRGAKRPKAAVARPAFRGDWRAKETLHSLAVVPGAGTG